jgi:hypothetical protein
MILRWTSLGPAVLGPCRLALDHCDEFVITLPLVALLLLLEALGRPITMVRDLLPLALRGVECHHDRLLAVCMVACDVEEFPKGTGHAAP